MKKETLKNKLAGLVLLLLGIGSIFIDGDATIFVILAIISVYLFIAPYNMIE